MNGTYRLARDIYYWIIGSVVNAAIVCTALLYGRAPRHISTVSTEVPVFIAAGKYSGFLAILSILSLSRHISELQFFVIDDGAMTWLQKWCLHLLQRVVPVTYIHPDVHKAPPQLRQYTRLKDMWKTGWVGRKFFVPRFTAEKYDRYIVVDCDTLFFSYPQEIHDWIHKKQETCLYLDDYYNFTAVSTVEAEHIMNKRLTHQRFNSGFLCIYNVSYKKNNPLRLVNTYLDAIIEMLKDRMTRDYYRRPEYYYSLKLLEQTLYWMTMNNCVINVLPSSYRLLHPEMSGQPVFVHFTPDSEEKHYEYRYLFRSLLTYVHDVIFRKPIVNPWYLYIDFIQYQRTYLTKDKFRSEEETFFGSMKLLLSD